MSLFRRKPKKEDDHLDKVQWSEADRALAKTRLESANVLSEWPAVERITGVLTHQLEQNNFSERIRLALMGGGISE